MNDHDDHPFPISQEQQKAVWKGLTDVARVTREMMANLDHILFKRMIRRHIRTIKHSKKRGVSGKVVRKKFVISPWLKKSFYIRMKARAENPYGTKFRTVPKGN